MSTVNNTYEILQNVHNNSIGALTTTNKFANYIPADYYMYKTNVTPSITSAVTLWDTTLYVNSASGITGGDVITVYEQDKMFQTLVVTASTTANTISIQAPIDYAFTSAAVMEVGDWNMAVDGSSTPQTFSIKAPPLADIDFHTLNVSMLDATAMDDGKFGGIAQLTNGLIYRYNDGMNKNLALIVNNLQQLNPIGRAHALNV